MELTKWKLGKTERGYSAGGLVLLDEVRNMVLSISKRDDGQIVFREECDGYVNVAMSKEDAVQALIEALAWVALL